MLSQNAIGQLKTLVADIRKEENKNTGKTIQDMFQEFVAPDTEEPTETQIETFFRQHTSLDLKVVAKKEINATPSYWSSWAKKIYNFSTYVEDFQEKEIFKQALFKMLKTTALYTTEILPKQKVIGPRCLITPTLNNLYFLGGAGITDLRFYSLIGSILKKEPDAVFNIRQEKGKKQLSIKSEVFQPRNNMSLLEIMRYLDYLLGKYQEVEKKTIGHLSFYRCPLIFFVWMLAEDFMGGTETLFDLNSLESFHFSQHVSFLGHDYLRPSSELVIITTKNPLFATTLCNLPEHKELRYGIPPTCCDNHIGKDFVSSLIANKDALSFLRNKESFDITKRCANI